MINELRILKRILFRLLLSLFLVSCTTEDDSIVSPINTPVYEVTSSTYQSGTLTFTAGENTPSDATFKLYLDTNAAPTTVYNLSNTSYNYSNLITNTKYYWKVETLSNTGTILATSEVFNFTTGIIYGGTLSLNQEQIDNFNYTKVEGDLRIEGFDNNSITSLRGLSSLTCIGGNLKIWVNDDLESLEGLESITSLGGYLEIVDNNALTNLDGLDGITSIGRSVTITGNSALTNLNGLDKITSIGSFLNININEALTSLAGLSNLVSVEGSFIIHSNNLLTSFTDLDAITSVGGDLQIWNNDNLINLNGLETLTTLGGNLYVGRTTNPQISGIGNTILYNLCGVRELITNGQVTSEEYFVQTNAYNPTYTEIQNTGSGGCEF